MNLDTHDASSSENGAFIDDQNYPDDNIVVNIFSQLALIEAIVKDIGMSSSHKIKLVPMFLSSYLHLHITSNTFSVSVTGNLNYLTQTSRPDLIFAVHQLDIFSSDPYEDHAVSIIYLGMYLNHTKDICIRVIGIRL
ncbi:hypothetical protein ACHAXS_004623 [Conticribra weissflogii]